MKVTALIPDQLVHEVERHTQGKNLTECLVIAMREWLALKKLTKFNKQISLKPLQFRRNFSAEKLREVNRKR